MTSVHPINTWLIVLLISGVDSQLSVGIPPVTLLLEEISSTEQPLVDSLRFLSALEQEIKRDKNPPEKPGDMKSTGFNYKNYI